MPADRTAIADLRRHYAQAGLAERDLAPDPLTQFARWLEAAVRAGLTEPTAMVVATVSAEGQPSARMVLLKGYDQRGFVFFTSYRSAKAGELTANPRAALVFPWHDLERQVRVTGEVARADRHEAAAYFTNRPRGSQLGAWASPQSSVIASRAWLDERRAVLDRRYPDQVPVPEWWGGYRVVPDTVEFWQGRADRLHDRLRYRRAADRWVVDRLGP